MYWPQVSPKKIKQFYSDYSEKNQTATEWITNGNKKVLEDLISLNAASVSEHDELEIQVPGTGYLPETCQGTLSGIEWLPRKRID